MALAMLPDITLLTGHRVSSVVEVLSVHATLGTVKVPFSFVILVLLEVSLELFALCLHLPLGLAFRIFRVSILRRASFAFSFQTGEFLFGQNSFGFAFF